MIGGLDNPVATGGSALFVALAIQALKNSGWATWFNRNTSRANLLLSVIAAYAAQLGKTMKRLILTLALFSSVACHPPPTVVTPAGQAAFKADQIVVRVNELQNAAIAANAQGLPEPTTRLLVTFCVGADKTLAQVPAGWPAMLKTSWAETKAKLPPITNPALQSAIAVVDAIIGGLQ